MQHARRPAEPRDEFGFTLIELLVVLVTVDILGSMAIPDFHNRRGRAHGAAVRADVSNLGKKMVTCFVEGVGLITLASSVPGRVVITDATSSTFARLTIGSRPLAIESSPKLADAASRCVALTDAAESVKSHECSAMNVVEPGTCP